MSGSCKGCGIRLSDSVTFCPACGALVESGVVPTQADNHRAAVADAIEADDRLRSHLGLAAAALAVLVLGIVVVLANRSSPLGRSSTASSTLSRSSESNQSSVPLKDSTPGHRSSEPSESAPTKEVTWLRGNFGPRPTPAMNSESVRPGGRTDGPPATFPDRAVKEPNETPEVVTAETLYKFPKLYEHRRVELVGWEHALVQTTKSVHAASPPFPADCKYLLNFSGGLGCVSTIPEHLLSPLGVAVEEDIDLTCIVERVTYAGSLLTHCEMSPSSYRRMEDRERQLETQSTRRSPAESSATDEAQPTVDGETPAQGRHRFVMGVLTNVHCDNPALELSVVSNGKRLRLHSGNYFRVQFSRLGASLNEDLNPCADLEGRLAKIEYVESAIKGVAGLVAIEIHE
jgi:hypothetical protein